MSNHRKVRVGIDVGGTHTKAVALDNETNEIVGESIVMTVTTTSWVSPQASSSASRTA